MIAVAFTWPLVPVFLVLVAFTVALSAAWLESRDTQ